MKKWEYLRGPYANQLDVLGADGWELVAACWNAEIQDYVYFFKRPLPET